MATAAAQRLSGNLRVPVTAFVGRGREIAEIRGLLSSSRLLTLTGVGGVGKTRLAGRVAADLQRAFPDGIWLVELAPLNDPALLTHTVATTLGIREASGRWPVAVLSEYLADKCLLLILDNCEHLLDACAVLADALLQAAAELRIVVTSRQPLGLPGEQTVVVAPLAVPDPETEASFAEIAYYDAVQLFVTRAADVLSGFTLTERNAAAIAALCARLDGLPMAIELAAARLRAFAPEQVLARLDERFRLLTAGSRAALPRQQTLRALVDWSFELCSPQEQALWGRLSVFAGSFDLDAAEEVCGDATLPKESVFELVAGLVDKSVLLREEHEGGVRYRLLDTIREYGRERLAGSGDELTWHRRHRGYYLALAERAAASWFSAEGPVWLDRMRLEHSNVRIALGFALSQPGEAEAGLRLAAVLWFGWRQMGLLSEGRRWLDRLLANATAPTPTRAQALWVNGSLAILQGDVPEARAMLAEATTLGRRLGDESAQAYAALFSGQVALVERDMVAGVRLFEQAMTALRASGDTFGMASALIRLALAASALGDADRASRLAEEHVALCGECGAQWLAAFGHFVLAVEFWRRGNLARAVDEAREAVRTHWNNHDRIGAAEGVEVLAWVAAAQHQAERAARLLGAVGNVWRTVGAPLFGLPNLVPSHDECAARSRRILGERAFALATQSGAALGFDAVVAYALEETAAVPTGDDRASSPLTRRELEIADLVAQGMSNKEIASTLVIAQRTAETHVEHVLTKLGFTSRAQIATWATARKAAMTGPEPGPPGRRSRHA
jgi:predicted ATPase/DNA-binding CsgD family transcriptional regulator